ncbi:MAG: PASTA domain-containing protein [Alistipes sp.]|nr:PASTA domain-containing protein [Alistipes sp.]
METLNKKWQKQMRRRLNVIKWAIILFIVLIFARLIYIQSYDPNIGKRSIAVHKSLISKQSIPALPGRILARDGRPLASSVERFEIAFDMASHGFDRTERFTEQADSLSKLLSIYFGEKSASWYRDTMLRIHRRAVKRDSIGFEIVDKRSLLGKLFNSKRNIDTVTLYKVTRHHTHTHLFRNVDANEWEQIRHYPILNESMGLVYHQTPKLTRIYPHGNLAMRTIGRTDVKHPYGIEYAYRDSLAGKKGVVHLQYMAPNFKAKIENDTLKSIPAVNGADIYTTLDMELQDVADRALREVLREQNAEWGTTVVMEVATGDILAMVNLSRTKSGYYEGPNHAINTPMEPGSTMKLATTLLLLEKGGMSPSKEYNSGYGRKVKVGNYNEVADSHPIGTKKDPSIDLRTAFAESANVYFLKAVIDHFKGREMEYYEGLCSLQFHRHTSLEQFKPQLPFLPKPGSAKWYGSTLGLLSYGYGLEITPMQTLTLYNAVANNGVMVAPRLIRRIERNKDMATDFPVKVVNPKICSDATLTHLRSFLEHVALTGTAKEYFGEDKTPFRVGAKTGTANTAKGTTYADAYHLGSMVTYLPADAPRYTLITAVYKKKGTGSIFGAKLAGPVQKRVATYLYNREREWAERLVVSDVRQLPTDVKGGNIEHIGNIASHFGLVTSYTSPTGWGTATTGISSITIKSTTADRRLVPDVRGMGLSDALYLLESRGMKVTFSGSGKVVQQSIEAGKSFKQGDKIRIRLE